MLIVRIKFSGDTTFYNPENYIINTLNVPFVSRDISYSLTTEGLDVEFSKNYNYEGFTADDIESIRLNEGGNYFHGVPTSVQKNSNKRSTTVTFFKEIHLLKKKKINRANLSELLSDTTNKRLFNNSNGNSTSVMWLLKVMFSQLGLADPTSSLSNKIAIKDKTSFEKILFSEMKLDMNLTYCINQNVAVFSTSPGSTLYDTEKEITYFDFVNIFCKLFGVYLANDENGYIFNISAEYKYSISDNYILDYKDPFYEAKNEKANFGFRFNDNRYSYKNNSETSLNSGWFSKEEERENKYESSDPVANWYNNLVFGYEDRSLIGSADEGSIYQLNSFIDYIKEGDPTFYGKIGEKIRNKTEKDYRKEFIKTRSLGSVVYSNVLRVVGTYGINIKETTIEQVTIL